MARYVFLPILRKCSSGRREILPFLRKAASCLPCKRLCREMQPLLQLSALRRGLLHGLRRTGSEAAAHAQAAATAGAGARTSSAEACAEAEALSQVQKHKAAPVQYSDGRRSGSLAVSRL